MDEHAVDVGDGLRRLEGYLLWQAEIATACQDATAFTDALPWLTDAQREDVAQAYTRERLRVSRQDVTRIAEGPQRLEESA
ncbi:hypothetical protein ACIRRH_38080 [Kitasatospora sp. NPDC101235]|uniref:hypothetical protein n=1 Tax=Kitasatospora sp. NPDC101235 TaxID=3364101 RepID=UPI003819A106